MGRFSNLTEQCFAVMAKTKTKTTYILHLEIGNRYNEQRQQQSKTTEKKTSNEIVFYCFMSINPFVIIIKFNFIYYIKANLVGELFIFDSEVITERRIDEKRNGAWMKEK